jgi:uncharacterized protein
MIKTSGPASSFFADAASAARAWPDLRQWWQTFLLLTLFASFTLLVAKLDTAFNFSVRTGWGELLAIAALGFFVPALGEEMVFRVALAGRTGVWRATLALALFVLWHPAQVWLGLPMAQPAFLEPGFLIIAAALGLTCTLAWRMTGSVWSAVVIHWLTVVGWKALLGG